MIFGTLSCATQKAQIDKVPAATRANVTPIASNENVIQTDGQTGNKDWLSYEPAVVELRGKLITRMYYGPPNYGENPKTDSKEVLPFLVLSKPVNVRGYPDPNAGPPEQVTVENVRRMELVLTLPHKNMIGKNVIVTGTLFHAFTGHHHTDVLMTVQTIRLAKSD
jgi:hypothetical protein